MKRIRIDRLGGQLLSTRSRATCLYTQIPHRPNNHRPNSTQAASDSNFTGQEHQIKPQRQKTYRELIQLPSPPPKAALKSAKLAALHARLALPQRFPLNTLARTLVDVTADPDQRFNNASLAVLGADLLGYHMAEHLICHYPRIPMDVLFAAQDAYVGPKALSMITREWGVERAAEPGGEVDPGLLQFRHAPINQDPITPSETPVGTGRPDGDRTHYRRGISSRIVHDDPFGNVQRGDPGYADALRTATPTEASTHFVRALIGALYLHTGKIATKKFFNNHFLSRTLNLSQLFDFRIPTRDLSRLCLREGFEPPIARLISETGRASTHPAFVVGVFSGRDKLGEGNGGSLDEARNRASTAALKGWYLYSPMDVTLPSEVESGDPEGRWKPNMVDPGEVIT
ncbi:hypothetical protein BLS_002353 [Venturia inaequalis]|uniref:Large ribosomal subunit protein mL44 n=1 Tax=Venturia inaequalis TaxID=5025 RepID=A0A8H3YW54_VENIN|nr:hypothetical protein BLS_002353 [Venturia inaequalis]